MPPPEEPFPLDPARSALLVVDMQNDFVREGAPQEVPQARLEGHAVIPELAPRQGEPQVDKYGYGGFHNTTLENVLRANGADQVVVTGTVTQICVEETVREGFHREVEVVARKGRPVGVVAFEEGSQGASAAAFGRAASVGKAQAAGELPQELEQAQIGPGAGLDSVDRGLGHPHDAGADGLTKHGLEVAEGRLALGDAGQVVLVQIEEHRPRSRRLEPTAGYPGGEVIPPSRHTDEAWLSHIRARFPPSASGALKARPIAFGRSPSRSLRCAATIAAPSTSSSSRWSSLSASSRGARAARPSCSVRSTRSARKPPVSSSGPTRRPMRSPPARAPRPRDGFSGPSARRTSCAATPTPTPSRWSSTPGCCGRSDSG